MYTVEVPMYSSPMERLVAANKQIHVVLYGSLPDSPFNGGRPNFLLDGVEGVAKDGTPTSKTGDAGAMLKMAFGVLGGFKSTRLDAAVERFYATIEEANRNGLPYWLAATNLSVSVEELTDTNTLVFERIVEIGERYGVKNAFILASDVLEQHLRAKYGTRVGFVSSCTKYYDKDKFLGPKQTLPRYLEDVKKYDWVVLTPQDSYHAKIMKTVVEVDPEKFIGVADVTCDRSCNAYDHYEMLSRYNKTSLVKIGIRTAIPFSHEYAKLDCPIIKGTTRAPNLLTRVPIMRKAGIRHYKLGRSFSYDMLSNIDGLLAALSRPDLSEAEEAALEAV